MKKQTQYAAIWNRLRRVGRASVRDLIDCGGGNWPHKRLAEMTDADGRFYAYNARLLREDVALPNGRKMRMYVLVRGA
jgi:hypothetical protein